MEKTVDAKTSDVLLHHIQMLGAGRLDEVMEDYTEKSVLISPDQSFHGRAEIRSFFQATLTTSPPEFMSAFTIIRQDIQGEVAYIVWKAEPFVKMGTDTFLIRNGKIAAQTFLTTV